MVEDKQRRIITNNQQRGSIMEMNEEEKIDRVLEKDQRWKDRSVPMGVRLLDSPTMRRLTRNGTTNKQRYKPISVRRFRREIERLEVKDMMKEKRKRDDKNNHQW